MIDCSKTENYLKEKARMTKCCIEIDCTGCPLSSNNNGKDCGCEDFQYLHTKEAITIVQKWSDEHPQKTYKDDFFEKFPNAPLAPRSAEKYPKVCRHLVYSERENCGSISCFDCWNEVMPE